MTRYSLICLAFVLFLHLWDQFSEEEPAKVLCEVDWAYCYVYVGPRSVVYSTRTYVICASDEIV